MSIIPIIADWANEVVVHRAEVIDLYQENLNLLVGATQNFCAGTLSY